MSDQLRKLAESVVNLGEGAQHTEGTLSVLTAAVAALVASHPDPSAFAAAFRRSWLLEGSQHSNDEVGSQAAAGIRGVLSSLEEACKAPLNVRPPA